MKTRTLAATALLLLTLTGCAGVAETAPTDAEKSSDTTSPLAAETETPVSEDPEAEFVAQVRGKLPANTQIPNATDEQLIEAGYAACDAIEADTPTDQISVIEGEQPNGLGYFDDSGIIVQATSTTLCPR